MISGFAPGNNYILVLALSADPTRKVAQTRGFWIKRNGTLPALQPSGPVQASGATVSGGVAASGTVTPTAPASSAPAAGQSGGASGTPAAGHAGKIVVSAFGVVAAGALALTAF